jgi:hypothetical protein
MSFGARRTSTNSGAESGPHNTARHRTPLHLAVLAAFVFFFCWPLLFHGISEVSDDAIPHASWDKSFETQLAAGEWYPRWLSQENDGLGSPIFFYYGPIPSYASSPFGILFGARDPDGWLQVGYGCFFAMLLSAIGAYFWLQSRVSGTAAIFGAAIYVIAPYHLAIDLYVRAATSELWSFVWMPLILLSVEALARRSRWGFPALAMSYALLAMTHLPTIVAFSPVVLAAAFFLAQTNRRIVTTVRAIAAMTLGAGLAAIYLIPAMFDRWKVNIGYLVSSRFDFRYQWFFRPIAWGLDFPERVAILNMTMFAFIGILLWVCLRGRGDDGERRVSIFCAGVAAFAFVFMSQLSYPFWQHIEYLRFVQFPWRFSMLLPLAAAMLTALSFSYFEERRARAALVALCVLVAAWIGVTVWAARPEVAALTGRVSPAMIAARSVVKSKPGPCEYLPVSAELVQSCPSDAGAQAEMLQELLGAHAAKTLSFTPGSADKISGAATVLDWKPRKVILDVDASDPGALTLRHFYYSGWTARVAETGGAIAIGPSRPEGFMQLNVPEGKHEIVVELTTRPSEKIGRMISLASLVCLAVVVVFLKLRARIPTSLPD